jgi:plastocyanin
MGVGSGSSGADYVPATLTVRVGQKVTWINRDVSGHTATADDGVFNSDVLNPGQHYSWTPKRAGIYPYSDYNQSNLQGTIIVKP